MKLRIFTRTSFTTIAFLKAWTAVCGLLDVVSFRAFSVQNPKYTEGSLFSRISSYSRGDFKSPRECGLQRRVFLVLMIAVLSMSNSFAQMPTFSKVCGDAVKLDNLQDVAALSDGGFVAVGSQSDNATASANENSLLIKVDAAGATVWTKVYDFGLKDGLNAVIQAQNGDLIVVGKASDATFTQSYAAVHRINSTTGAIIWSKITNYTARTSGSARVVLEETDGRILVGGNRNDNISSGISVHSCYFHVSADGTTITDDHLKSFQTIGGAAVGQIRSIQGDLIRRTNGVLVSSLSQNGDGFYDPNFTVFNADGTAFLSKNYNLGPDNNDGYGLKENNAKTNFTMFGAQRTSGGTKNDMWSAQVDYSGNMTNHTRYITGGLLANKKYRIITTRNASHNGVNGYLIAALDGTGAGQLIPTMFFVDETGTPQWMVGYDAVNIAAQRDGNINGVCQTLDGGFVGVGFQLNASGNRDMLIIKAGANGLVSSQSCMNLVGTTTTDKTYVPIPLTMTYNVSSGIIDNPITPTTVASSMACGISACPKVVAKNDNFTLTAAVATGVPTVGNIFADNGNKLDSFDVSVATISNTTISIITAATPIGGAPVPVLTTSTGDISIPANTPYGTYTIVYKIQDATNPAFSSTATITIVYGSACATPSVGGTANYSGGTVCTTANMGTITLTGQTGNVIKWQTSTNGTTWTDIASTLNKTTYNFINAANGQQFRAVVNANVVTCTDEYSSVVTIVASATACTTTVCSYNSSSFSPTIATSSNPSYTTHVILINPTTGNITNVTAANSTAFTGVALGDYVMYAVTYDNTMFPTPTITVGTNISTLTGCTSFSDALLTKVCCPTIAAPSVTITQPTCGVTTGSIAVTNPTSGVTYSFDNGATFQVAATKSNLTASTTYQVITKENGNGCLSTATPSVIDAVLNVPNAPTTSVLHPACGATTGTITVTNPTSGVTYSFDNGTTFQAAATSNALSSGTYSVKVKDNSSNCVSQATPSVLNAILAVPSAPTATVAQPNCSTATGTITITTSITGLECSFDNGVSYQTAATSSPLASGTYSVLVRNTSNGCASPNISKTINPQPVSPSLPTVSVTQPTCTNATGTLTITQPTDVGMTYSIDGTTYTNTTGIFNNVASGTYNVSAKSAVGCISAIANATINVIIPAPTVTITQPTCVSATGSFTVTSPVGAGFSYSVDLVDYSNTSGVFANLSPATYKVSAKNASGCVSSETSVVILPPVPAPIVATNQPNCATSTGTITITTPSTGVTYSFNNGVTFQTSNVLTNVAPATYQIVVKNTSDGCQTSPKDVMVSAAPTVGCNCNNATGTITATVSNQNASTAIYTQKYVLTNNAGAIIRTSNSPTFIGLTSNTYAIYALNYKNTEGVNNLTVGQNISGVNGTCLDVSAPLFYTVCIPVVSCNNASGNITAQVSGQNTNAAQTQSYALTDSAGVIVQTATSPNFTVLTSNQYAVYALNYKTTEGVNGLTVGQNISGVNGTCLDISAPLFYRVCLPVFSCNNNSGNITAQVSGQNTNAAFTQSYVLTDSVGVILKLSNTPTFTGLLSGRYKFYGLNYETASGVTSLSVGMSISSVIGACFNKTNPLLYQVCIVPEICNNRIDDDGDGLIDGEDITDCPSNNCDNTTGDITFTNTGQTVVDYTQVYVLTDSTGKILKTNSTLTFTGLSSGRYRVYAVNYRTSDGITGIIVGGNVNSITGTCFDKSLPLLFKVCLCVTMNVKVMLEGPYVTASSTMQTILNDRGLLPGQTPTGQFALATPQGQPYKGIPWNYAGTEGDTITTYPATVVDWVLLTLRKDSTTTDSVFRVTGWLHNDGHISFISPCFDIANGNYFIVIEHRNHIGVMSPNRVPIVNGVMAHDFTVNDSYVFINPPSFGQKQKGTKWVMYAGDGKKDTRTTNFDVNFQDSQYWKLQSGIFDQYKNGDYNMDADVNFADSYLWKFNSGKYSGVPH